MDDQEIKRLIETHGEEKVGAALLKAIEEVDREFDPMDNDEECPWCGFPMYDCRCEDEEFLKGKCE